MNANEMFNDVLESAERPSTKAETKPKQETKQEPKQEPNPNTQIEKKSSNGLSAIDKAKIAMKQATKQNTLSGLKHTQVSDVLNGLKSQIAAALPKHLTAERIIQMSSTLISRNPKIAECSIDSLVGAVMQASILGFEPVAALGQCSFIPYNGSVDFQIGYKGWLELIWRTNKILDVYADVVYKDDYFVYESGENRKLVHKPNFDVIQNDKNIIMAYAVAHLKGGGRAMVVKSRNNIETLRLRNPSQRNGVSGAWKTDYAEMAKAKVLKSLCKHLPVKIDYASISDEMVIKPQNFENGELKISEADYNEEFGVYEIVDENTGELTEFGE